MLLISKCRRDLDLGLRTTSGLAFEELMCNGEFRRKKPVLAQEKLDFAIAHWFFKRKS